MTDIRSYFVPSSIKKKPLDDIKLTTIYNTTQLDTDQLCALEAVKQGRNVFITGCAGVGKSFLIQYIKDYLIQEGKRIQILAPTGVASVHVGGLTLHSFLECRPSIKEFSEYIRYRRKSQMEKKVKNIDAFIIDEISMLNDTMFHLFENVCRYYSGHKSKVFGGIQLILVGDLLQLPPVEGDPYLFKLNVWKELNLYYCYLNRIHRQENNFFTKALCDLRLGLYTNDLKSVISLCLHNKIDPTKEYVLLYATNQRKDLANQQHLVSLQSDPRTFKAKDIGQSHHFKGSLVHPEVTLKVGCRVMLLKNKLNYGLYNGSIGHIISFKEKFPQVQFNNGQILNLPPETWEITGQLDGKLQTIASRTQIPLVLAYALTIHKTQSLTLDRVILDCKDIFSCGQFYVAMSRVKTLDGLVLRNFHPKCIKADDQLINFYNTMK